MLYRLIGDGQRDVVEPVEADSDIEASVGLLTRVIERDCGFLAAKVMEMPLEELLNYSFSYPDLGPVKQGSMIGSHEKMAEPVERGWREPAK